MCKEVIPMFPLFWSQNQCSNKVTDSTKGKVMLSIWLISSRKGAVSLPRKVQSLYFEWYYFLQLDQSWFNVKKWLVRFKVIAQSLCLYSQDINSPAWKKYVLLYILSIFILSSWVTLSADVSYLFIKISRIMIIYSG